jgi:hypothetical protein
LEEKDKTIQTLEGIVIEMRKEQEKNHTDNKNKQESIFQKGSFMHLFC